MKYRLLQILKETPETILSHNFWKIFPECKLMEEFQDIYTKDKATTKKKSSKIMWAIVLMIHPESMYYNIPDKDVQLIVTFIKDKTFSWDDYHSEVYSMKSILLTQAERSLVHWEETMKMRDKSLKTLYRETLKTKDVKLIKAMDDILGNNTKLYKEFNQITDLLKKEEGIEKTTKKDVFLGDEI
tara:strand:- start:284 stop:838 length:555 start_codon:yes stop_codon:yes gene_type:complete